MAFLLSKLLAKGILLLDPVFRFEAVRMLYYISRNPGYFWVWLGFCLHIHYRPLLVFLIIGFIAWIAYCLFWIQGAAVG